MPAIQLIADGSLDHIIGTVVKIENRVLTVKARRGNADGRLNEKDRNHGSIRRQMSPI